MIVETMNKVPQNEAPRQCWTQPRAGRTQPRAERHLQQPETKDAVDKLLAEAMKHLSFEERQAEQEDLHGVADTIIESDEEIETWLQELDHRLRQLQTAKTSYEQAEAMDSSYVTNRDFRLMFLRANRYDAKAAADQLIRFFDVKKKLFGKEKLVRDITLGDLNDDDRACLQSGSLQILHLSDNAKRQIVLELPRLRIFKTLQNELRARYYIYQSLLQSKETQLGGIVIVAYSVGEFKDKINRVGFLENARVSLALPLHYAGIHVCSTNQMEHIVGSSIISLMPAKLKARFKIQYGSHMECQYHLSTYGISPQALPFDSQTNKVSLGHHLLWYSERLLTETGYRVPEENLAIQPDPNDVIFSGGRSSNNGGNQRLRLLTKRFSEAYKLGKHSKKRELIDMVISEINISSGRFLKQVGSSLGYVWEELPLEEIRLKISQMFRNARRSYRPSSETIKTSSAAGEVKVVDSAGPNDVVFGRKKYSGRANDLLRQLVAEAAAEYDSANRGQKAQIVGSIVQRLHGEACLFLSQTESGQIEEVPTELAKTKISRMFRNNRRNSLQWA